MVDGNPVIGHAFGVQFIAGLKKLIDCMCPLALTFEGTRDRHHIVVL
jgi:hypothetical protein